MDQADTPARRQEDEPGTATLRRSDAQGHPRAGTVVWLAVVVLLFLGLAGGFWLYNVQPFEQGSTTGAGPNPSYLRTEDDPFGSGSAFVYCDQPGGLIAWAISLYNTSPLPVRLLGAAPDVAAQDPNDTNAYWLESLASRSISASVSQPATDPRQEPDLAPTTIQPGQEIELWARYRMGGLSLQDGARITTRSLSLRISILGLERTVDAPLDDGIQVIGPVCGS